MSLAEWSEAFTKAQAEFPSITKGRTADMERYTYKYADLGDVLAGVLPVLHNHGLSTAQDVTGNKGTVAVATRIYHTSGHVESFGPLEMTAGNTPQMAGSAITYARRYALCAALGIAPDEDDDGARASQRPAEPPEERPEPPEESEADRAFRFIKEEGAVFKEWTKTERNAAYKTAMEMLAYDKLSTMVEAQNIFEHMRNAYETREGK
jgi:hypothetical protein